jgi:hypothetical protein
MGERRPGRDHELRLTMSEAAKVLNTSRDAIRMRVRRGSHIERSRFRLPRCCARLLAVPWHGVPK